MRSNNIVYLYSEIMPYNTIVFDWLIKMGYNIHAFEFHNYKKTKYVPQVCEHFKLYNSLDYNNKTLLNKVLELDPVILLVCGWSSKLYLSVAKFFRKNTSIPVISPIDSQYLGTLKQKIGFLLSPLIIKPYFSHIWVPGVRQYYFAKRLGYDNDNLLMFSLSGNIDLFQNVQISIKEDNYPKSFLFVGRYHKVKGLNNLIDAWKSIKDKKGWTLKLVGNGPMRSELEGVEGIEVYDFMQQDELVKIAQDSGCFILPSSYEPWALVLHEFSAAGLPIICTSACGASPHFVVDGYNGYTYRANNLRALKGHMENIIHSETDKLIHMSYNSRNLSSYVTPEISAKSLLSVLTKV